MPPRTPDPAAPSPCPDPEGGTGLSSASRTNIGARPTPGRGRAAGEAINSNQPLLGTRREALRRLFRVCRCFGSDGGWMDMPNHRPRLSEPRCLVSFL